jgi:hypothetical protein
LSFCFVQDARPRMISSTSTERKIRYFIALPCSTLGQVSMRDLL